MSEPDKCKSYRIDTIIEIIETTTEIVRQVEPGASANHVLDYAVNAVAAMSAEIALQQPDPEHQLRLIAAAVLANAEMIMHGSESGSE